MISTYDNLLCIQFQDQQHQQQTMMTQLQQERDTALIEIETAKKNSATQVSMFKDINYPWSTTIYSSLTYKPTFVLAVHTFILPFHRNNLIDLYHSWFIVNTQHNLKHMVGVNVIVACPIATTKYTTSATEQQSTCSVESTIAANRKSIGRVTATSSESGNGKQTTSSSDCTATTGSLLHKII